MSRAEGESLGFRARAHGFNRVAATELRKLGFGSLGLKGWDHRQIYEDCRGFMNGKALARGTMNT